MLIGTDQAHIWRELERIEQRLSRGVDSAASQLYDSMGRPAAQAFTNFGNHFALGLARVDRVRQALDQSGPMARRMVEQQLSGIGIATVWDILVAACKEIALYYGGAVVTGAALGGAIGSAAFGVGAVPGAVIGTAAGAQVGTWVMALMGLKDLAEGLAGMLPAALDHYERGFREAWGAAPEERRDLWKSNAPASGNTYTAAWHLSQGHAIMVTAILTALVAYLTRGRGNKAVLMQEIRKSPKLGQKFADWLIENEGKLLGHPQLQARPSSPAGVAAAESLPPPTRGASPPTGKAKVGASGTDNPLAREVVNTTPAGTIVESGSGSIYYGAKDGLGRPTGVSASITKDMIKTGTPANPGIQPPGWAGDGIKFNQARGHLLGNQLGGSGDIAENLVTLQHNWTNSPVMRGYESQVRAAVESGQIIQYSATPMYNGLNPIPRGVTLIGTGNNGFNLGVTILNPIGF